MSEDVSDILQRVLPFLSFMAVVASFIFLFCVSQEMKAHPTMSDVGEAFRQRDQVMQGMMERILKDEKDHQNEKGTK